MSKRYKSNFLVVSIILVMLIPIWGCNKPSDTTPPHGSVINMPEDTSVAKGSTVEITAVVLDDASNPANGVEVKFISGSKANFSGAQTTTVETNRFGLAKTSVTFANTTGEVVITGDIRVDTDSTTFSIE